MSGDSLDDVLDDHFLGCALAAFMELAVAAGRMPDSEATRRLAYRYYEEDLAEKNAARPGDPAGAAAGPVDSGPESRYHGG
ncbi:MAG: hypothetical protein K2X87_08310 [Gemmataceae bacterium]|nr:hypothetical protein [Gemmataceae bacterium]